MQYLKRNTKYSILAFLLIVLSITTSISTLAKTDVYFSLYGNSQILSTTSPKPEVQIINTNTSSQDEFLNILQTSKPLARKVINSSLMSFPRMRETIILREKLGGFKELQDILQLLELTNLDWKKCEEEGIKITNNKVF